MTIESARRGWRRRLVDVLVVTLAALATALLVPAAVPAADAATPCSGSSSYKGTAWCPATIEGVKATQYGTGKRVYLDNAVVSAVSTGTVTVQQQRWRNPCKPGSYCGQLLEMYWVSLTVPWTGSSRPATGAAIKLYGTTVPGNLAPAGWEPSTPPCGDYC